MQPPFQPPPNAPLNPFQPPAEPLAPPPPPVPPVGPATPAPVQREVSVMDALRFTTSGPSGWSNLMYLALLYLSTQIIPIAGLIVMYGFFAEVHRRLVLRRGEPYLRFDFADLMPYFMRGLAPLVMGIIVAMPFAFFLAALLVTVVVVARLAVQGAADENLVMAVTLGGVGLVSTPVMVLWFALQNAAMTRAELTGDIGKSVKLGALWSYAGKTWKTVLWTGILGTFLAIGLSLLGLVACIVGIFVTMSMVLVVQLHLRWQIYNRYLLEGGEPIELAPFEALPSEGPKAPPPGVPPR
jgi:hypothetical protein